MTIHLRPLNTSQKTSLLQRGVKERPKFERTDGEKVRLAQSFLERRGFVVFPDLMTLAEVAAYMRCSTAHVSNLMKAGKFIKPVDVGAFRTSIDSSRKQYRFRATDLFDWLNNDIVEEAKQ